MKHKIRRHLSFDDILQPSSSDRKHIKYAPNVVASTGCLPPVNLCGNHFRQHEFHSTPDLTNPWENVRVLRPTCKEIFMRGLNPNYQTTCMFR